MEKAREFAGHGVQAGDPSAAYESKLQGEHVAFDTAAVTPEYHPAVHMVHGKRPAEGFNFPASHALHHVSPVLLPV